jgi:hypothetical protein
MECPQGRTVADRDHRGVRQALRDQAIKPGFGGLVDRGGRLVQKQELRRV